MKNVCNCFKIKSLALAVSLGILTGICMMLFTWTTWVGGQGRVIIEQWATVYPGLDASLEGGFIALGWGLLEGFIFGLLLGWLYNLCLFCSACRSCGCCTTTCCCCNASNPNPATH